MARLGPGWLPGENPDARPPQRPMVADVDRRPGSRQPRRPDADRRQPRTPARGLLSSPQPVPLPQFTEAQRRVEVERRGAVWSEADLPDAGLRSRRHAVPDRTPQPRQDAVDRGDVEEAGRQGLGDGRHDPAFTGGGIQPLPGSPGLGPGSQEAAPVGENLRERWVGRGGRLHVQRRFREDVAR